MIVFIDEVHTLIGSGTVGRGNKGSGLDIANLLKPPLGRGELQVLILLLFLLYCYSLSINIVTTETGIIDTLLWLVVIFLFSFLCSVLLLQLWMNTGYILRRTKH